MKKFILIMLASVILASCQTATKNQPIEKTLPQPEVVQTLNEPVEQETSEITKTAMPGANCKLNLDIPWEHDESNPLTDENKILEIVSALSDFETCNLTQQEGWLLRYDTQEGKRQEGSEFLAHLTGKPDACDLQLGFIYSNGNLTSWVLLCLDRYDYLQVTRGDCLQF